MLLVWALAGSVSSEQNNFDKREAAYRANNLGVALLEQYKPKEAAESFERSLGIDPDLRLAQINLCIALYYLPDPDAARLAAGKALTNNPYAPQPHYILGLIARTDNRYDDAIKEFESVLAIDNEDAATNVNIGQIYVQEKKYDQAIPAFRKALDAEPYNEAALYNLGILLTRTGAREEGQRVLRKFQQLQQSGAGTKIGTAYLEGGHYAEAIVSTGAEADLVDRKTPEIKFADASDALLPKDTRTLRPHSDSVKTSGSAKQNRNPTAEAIVLLDYDGDDDLDIFDASVPPRLLRNDGRSLTDVTAGAGLSISGSDACFAAIAADYDNDGRPDLFVVYATQNKFVLYHNDGGGHFSDRTKEAGIATPSGQDAAYVSAAFVDFDHDGDLDIFVTGPANILLRNNGNGAFTEITRAAGVSARSSAADGSAVIPTDFDNRRDVDLFLLDRKQPPALLRNMRDGTFQNVAKEVGLDNDGAFRCAAAGDVNKDGFTDFFMSSGTRAVLAMSDGRNHFKVSAAPAAMNQAVAAQFLDYDNDGLLDLLTVTTRGVRLWRDVGNEFVEVSATSLPTSYRNLSLSSDSAAKIVSVDLDNDGDIDLILRGANGALRILRNDGGNRNHSLKVDMHGHVSNRSAVEAKVEMRAGSLYQKLEVYSASPAPAPSDLIFGLGKREKPDAVRVLWPAGIVQAETEFPAASSGLVSLNVTEIDRKPSSCPYLYAWNGKQFEFITDFMGGGEMGYLESPGRYNIPDPVEYVRIRNDQLKAKDGRYELRVTNELEEAMFVDRLQLLVVNHPSATEVYPNEGMSDPPKRFRLFVTKDARPPASAVDDQGNDVLDLISRMDRRWPDDFKTERIRGYAAEHSLTLRLNRESKVQSPKSKVLLLLTGWTDYAWSSDNVAAIQSGREMQPPSLQVKDRRGKWQTVIKDIGIPVGRPQTVTVDLTGKFLSANREVRIVTNMRVYWDQILVDTSDRDSPRQITRLDPVRADLHWRGFSAETSPDNREPWGYDYRNVSFTSPWKVMTGRYTREGDVRELLLHSDDMFVVSRPGDEIILSFDAASLTPLPPGWTRTFLLYADGFSKEMDINSASPDQLAPLPFHGMSHYPYRWPEHYPLDVRHREYLDKYNTRLVTTQVPRLVAVGER
ncbi:MAG TPA: FG-GAP-like repeat-containing protein [Pyrinomonadaceae bacterium]|nr:FG-GAP-like repeat-containing protein [Pyrinomonadaceae bacterium]